MDARSTSADPEFGPAPPLAPGADAAGLFRATDLFDAFRLRAARVDWPWWGILTLATFLRLFWLGIKPPHFDEGINGWFVDQMLKNGFYRYDPTNYHGPLHFYILFLSQTLLGRSIYALRLPVVFGSIFCVHLATKFEPLTGRTVSRIAAAAMAVSPAFVFYGRYSIHEVWLLMFSMFFVLGILGLWRFGTRPYLWCVGMGFAGMVLTKETYVIHTGCALLAGGCVWISNRLARMPEAACARQSWTYPDLAAVIAVGLTLIVFFYSGNFFNWRGVLGLYETFSAWAKTGQNGNGHEKPWYYWLKLIVRYELPVAAGLILCLCCQLFKNLALRFLAIYGVGTLTAYSIVHYKTPWCIISIVWPLLFVFVAGLLLVPQNYRLIAFSTGGLLTVASLGSCIWLNYFHCTTDTEPYVYVQTYNDIEKLTRPLLKLAKQNPSNYQLIGHIVRPSAYPLPWTLGDFNKVGYYEKDISPPQPDADFLLVEEARIPEFEKKLQKQYYTEPLTLRQYQEPSKLYLSYNVFKKLFHNRAPDFDGASAHAAPNRRLP